MQYLRVSASDIDALRRFMSPPEGMEIEIDELLRQLRKEEPPSESMLAGTALHKALEGAAIGELSKVDVDGFRFSFDCDGEIDVPSVREVKTTRDYEIGGCTVTLVGKVDAIHGKRVDDHKFTSRYDAERFLSSYQWRIYLEVFDADEFRWNIFEGREIAQRHYAITNLHKLTMHRYPGMLEDVTRQVDGFIGFARTFLPERFTDTPAPSSEEREAASFPESPIEATKRRRDEIVAFMRAAKTPRAIDTYAEQNFEPFKSDMEPGDVSDVVRAIEAARKRVAKG